MPPAHHTEKDTTQIMKRSIIYPATHQGLRIPSQKAESFVPHRVQTAGASDTGCSSSTFFTGLADSMLSRSQGQRATSDDALNYPQA